MLEIILAEQRALYKSLATAYKAHQLTLSRKQSAATEGAGDKGTQVSDLAAQLVDEEVGLFGSTRTSSILAAIFWLYYINGTWRRMNEMNPTVPYDTATITEGVIEALATPAFRHSPPMSEEAANAVTRGLGLYLKLNSDTRPEDLLVGADLTWGPEIDVIHQAATDARINETIIKALTDSIPENVFATDWMKVIRPWLTTGHFQMPLERRKAFDDTQFTGLSWAAADSLPGMVAAHMLTLPYGTEIPSQQPSTPQGTIFLSTVGLSVPPSWYSDDQDRPQALKTSTSNNKRRY